MDGYNNLRHPIDGQEFLSFQKPYYAREMMAAAAVAISLGGCGTKINNNYPENKKNFVETNDARQPPRFYGLRYIQTAYLEFRRWFLYKLPSEHWWSLIKAQRLFCPETRRNGMYNPHSCIHNAYIIHFRPTVFRQPNMYTLLHSTPNTYTFAFALSHFLLQRSE